MRVYNAAMGFPPQNETKLLMEPREIIMSAREEALPKDMREATSSVDEEGILRNNIPPDMPTTFVPNKQLFSHNRKKVDLSQRFKNIYILNPRVNQGGTTRYL